ncbi:MAG: thioredoxin family protein [Eubacteriales bacterium]
MKEIKLNEDNIEAAVSGEEGVLLDFYAERCGACRTVFRVLGELTGEGDDFVLGKVDVDAEPGLAKRFGIVRVPTLVAVKRGEEVRRLCGLQSKSAIAALINDVTQ